MQKIARILVLGMVLLGLQAWGAGFDQNHRAYRGDLNGDGRTDIYIRRIPSTFVIPLDDIPIVIPAGVRDFVLENDGQGSFTLITQLTAAQRATLAQWQSADIDLRFRDVNADGRTDVELDNLASVVTGAFDQAVYAGPSNGATPAHVLSKDEKYLRYHSDLMHWMLDPTYFTRGVRVTGVEPATRVWTASIANASFPRLITSTVLKNMALSAHLHPLQEARHERGN